MTQKHKKLLTLLLVLALLFIWGNSLMSREFSGWVSDTIMEHMNRAASALGLGDDLFTAMKDTDHDGVEEPTSFYIRKAAHVTEFAALGCLLWLRLEKRGWPRYLWALVLGTACGGADEALQLLSHRGSLLSDVGVDAIGVLLGVTLTALIARRVQKKRERR